MRKFALFFSWALSMMGFALAASDAFDTVNGGSLTVPVGRSALIVSSGEPALPLPDGMRSELDPKGWRTRLESIEKYTIVIPEGRDPQSVRGAERLAETVLAMSGVSLAVTDETAFTGGCAFYIGETEAAARKGFKGPDSLEGYRIAKDGADVYLLGNRRGPAQAVLALIEEDWGVRWFAVSAPKLYRKVAADGFSAVARTYVPPFDFREVVDTAAMDAAWSAFNRYQPVSFFAFPEHADGGALANGDYFCHTYARMIPADRYFDSHPEYFPLRDGKRFRSSAAHGQLCYTSPGLEDELVRLYEAAMAERPECRLYACAANDNMENDCECASCAKLIASDGVVGAQLDLANRVSAKLAVLHPDVLLKTTAYVNTQEPPPNVRPGSNVMVEYCPIRERAGTDIYRPWSGNEKICREFGGWRKIAPNIGVWDYGLCWDMKPMPNFEVLHENIRYWRASGVRGVLIQETEVNRVNFQELRAWVLAKLLWNPSYDLERLVAEFMRGHYGPAGDAMLEYYHLQIAVYRDFKKRDRPNEPASLRFDESVVASFRKALQKAWRAADGDETVRARIAQEACAFLALPLSGCSRDKIETYRKDLALMRKLTERYAIALDAVNDSSRSVEARNAGFMAKWEKILDKASTANPLPVYCPDSVTLDEKKPWYPCAAIDDAGALAPRPVRHPRAPGQWLTQWDYSELVSTVPNQTVYVVRQRLKGEFKGGHAASDAIMRFAISRLGDSVSPGVDIRYGDIPKDGEWGFVTLAKVYFYTVSPNGYFYNADRGLNDGESLCFDYLEFIPEEQFKEKRILDGLPTLVL